MYQDRRASFDNTNASPPDAPFSLADSAPPSDQTTDRSAIRLRRLIFWASAAISVGLITLIVQSVV